MELSQYQTFGIFFIALLIQDGEQFLFVLAPPHLIPSPSLHPQTRFRMR